MAKREIPLNEKQTLSGPPAMSPESREQQIAAAALNLLERRIRDGTATSQEVVTAINLGSVKASLEKEAMRSNKILTDSKVESIKSATNSEALYSEAVKSMTIYQGRSEVCDYDFEN